MVVPSVSGLDLTHHRPRGPPPLRYIALGAFDDARSGEADVPVAFVIAEVCRLDETRVGRKGRAI